MRVRGAWRAAQGVALAALAAGLAACGGDGGLRCEEPGPYTTSRTAPPVRVPENLSVPNEDDALTIPPARGGGDSRDGEDDEQSRCLERPPDYFEGGEPQGASQ